MRSTAAEKDPCRRGINESQLNKKDAKSKTNLMRNSTLVAARSTRLSTVGDSPSICACPRSVPRPLHLTGMHPALGSKDRDVPGTCL